jgi:hypothetical protein
MNDLFRDQALSLMEARGAILDTAREVSRLIRESGLSAAVIGGIAVVLHGHWRATKDIDLQVGCPLQEIADLLESHGFSHDPDRREFVRDGIPVHLVPTEQTGMTELRTIEMEGILTVPLADLIAMKLRSGTKNLLRAQDLADVIGLIRHHQLTGGFAREIDKTLRPAFRKLVEAMESERA